MFTTAPCWRSPRPARPWKKADCRKGQAISRAIDIIGSGLRASLNHRRRRTGLPARRALRLPVQRLLHANLNNDRGALDEVTHLLTEIKTAWEEIADDPAVASRNKSAA